MKITNHICTIALLAVSCLATPVLAQTAAQPTLSISATGTVSARPDQASVSFGVHSTAENAATAMSANNAAMARAILALESQNIAPDDIATTSLALSPRYNTRYKGDVDRPPAIVGYTVHNTVVATVRDLGSLGMILDGLVEAGVNGINDVSFGISNTEDMEKAARIQAAKLARDMAETYAESIGTKVSGIISMSETGGARPEPYRMTMAMDVAKGSVPVSAGTRDVSVTLHVVFAIDGTLK